MGDVLVDDPTGAGEVGALAKASLTPGDADPAGRGSEASFWPMSDRRREFRRQPGLVSATCRALAG